MSDPGTSKPLRPRSRILGCIFEIFAPGVGIGYVGRPALAIGWCLANIVLLVSYPFLTYGAWIFFALRIGAIAYVIAVGGRSKQSEWTTLPVARIKKPRSRKMILALVGCASIFSFATARMWWFEGFKVPAGSMAPTLVSGDHVTAHKGAYWFSDPAPGDVIVFDHPCTDMVYVKRVVAIAGDTVGVRCNALFINGLAAKIERTDERVLITEEFQGDVTTVEELVSYETLSGSRYAIIAGPVDNHSARFNVSEFPTGEPPRCSTGPGLIGKEVIGEIRAVAKANECEPTSVYVVPTNHVFVLGDNRANSYDSRQWGSVPVNSVIGKVRAIWWSKSPAGNTRWGRIGQVR